MKLEIDTNELPKSYSDGGGFDGELFKKIRELELYVEKYKDLWIVNRAVLQYKINPETGKRIQNGSLHWFSKSFRYKTAKTLAQKWSDPSYKIRLSEHDGDKDDLNFRNTQNWDKDRMKVIIYNLYDYNMSVQHRIDVREEIFLQEKFWSYEGDQDMGWINKEEAEKY